MTQWLSCFFLPGLLFASQIPAQAQAGPYDRTKALTLGAEIEGIKIGMPIEEARKRLTEANYITPPQPNVAGGRYAGRALPPPCGQGRPPIEELRYTLPDVPRDFQELVLRYDCARQSVVLITLKVAESRAGQPSTPPPTVEGAPMFAQARVVYEELCGPYVAAKAPATHSLELEGPKELDARLRCVVTQNNATADMSKKDGGVSYKTGVNVGLLGPSLYGYSRHLAGLPAN